MTDSSKSLLIKYYYIYVINVKSPSRIWKVCELLPAHDVSLPPNIVSRFKEIYIKDSLQSTYIFKKYIYYIKNANYSKGLVGTFQAT